MQLLAYIGSNPSNFRTTQSNHFKGLSGTLGPFSPGPAIAIVRGTGGQCWTLTNVMRTNWVGAILKYGPVILLAILGFGSSALSQEVSLALLRPDAIQPARMAPAAPMVSAFQPVTLPEAPSRDRFWDRENSFLFATNAAFSAADFVVTRDNLRAGGQELNPVTRMFYGSTAGLAVNFAGETVGVVGLSYLFHKTGHHRLERAVSMLNIGASAGAVTFDLAHR